MTTSHNHTDSTIHSSSVILTQALHRLFGRSMGVSRILMKFGFEGYGVYCAVIELLSEQVNQRYIIDYELIAFAIGADADTVRRVVQESGMFCEETDNGVRYLYLPELRKAEADSDQVSAGVPCPNLSHAGTVEQNGTNRDTRTVRTHEQPTVMTSSKPTAIVSSKPAWPVRNTSRDKSEDNYSLTTHRNMLRADTEWLTRIGAGMKLEPEIMPAVFDAFADYVAMRNDILYQTEKDMTKHFCNWLLKGCGDKAANKARHAMIQEKEAEARREQQRERERLQRAHAKRSITYEEYCRQQCIESTGNIVQDIARRVVAARTA